MTRKIQPDDRFCAACGQRIKFLKPYKILKIKDLVLLIHAGCTFVPPKP